MSVWAYALMSNHLLVVVQTHAGIAADWSAEAVGEHWGGPYPPEDGQHEAAEAMIVGNEIRLAVLRRERTDRTVGRRRGSLQRPSLRLVSRNLASSAGMTAWLERPLHTR